MNCSKKRSQFAWGIFKNAAGFWLVREVGVCLTFLEFQIQPSIEGKSFSGIFWRFSDENESIRNGPLEVFRSWNMACPVKPHHLPRWFPAETSMASQLASTSRPQWPGSTCFFPPRQHEEHLESREFLGWSDAQQREWWIWWMVCDGTKWCRNYGTTWWRNDGTPCN